MVHSKVITDPTQIGDWYGGVLLRDGRCFLGALHMEICQNICEHEKWVPKADKWGWVDYEFFAIDTKGSAKYRCAEWSNPWMWAKRLTKRQRSFIAGWFLCKGQMPPEELFENQSLGSWE